MGKANEYFLVARNRLSNQFQILKVDGKRSNSLEELDLYTTSFKDEYDLEDVLQEEGILSDDDTDFFIVHQTRVNGQPKLVKQEVLFSIHSVVRDIAKNSKRGEIAKSEYLIDHILDSFADKMRRTPTLYEDVTTGKTAVFEKYAKYFIMTRQNLASIKYRDGGWARTSYPLIRNIVEASSRRNAKYARMSDQMYRSLLDQKLLDATTPGYNPDQLSFFDMGVETMVPVDEDKLLEVMSSFEHLPASTVLIENEKAIFNRNTFPSYEGNDLEVLQTKLTSELLLRLRLFLVQRDCLDTSPASMGGVYQNPIRQGQQDMIQLLKNHPDVLDNAYDWCQVYHKYAGKVSGDVHGREYQKNRGNEGQGTN